MKFLIKELHKIHFNLTSLNFIFESFYKNINPIITTGTFLNKKMFTENKYERKCNILN